MNTRLRTGLCVLLFSLMLPCLVVAAEEPPTVYVIKQGDTLWGLSQRFLNDPHYWPNLWSKNQQVTNPHLIYPGQTVRFVDGRMEIVPSAEAGGQKAAAAPVQQMNETLPEKTFTVRGNEGRLVETEMLPAGRIIAGQHGRLILGQDDTAFTDIGSDMGASTDKSSPSCENQPPSAIPGPMKSSAPSFILWAFYNSPRSLLRALEPLSPALIMSLSQATG